MPFHKLTSATGASSQIPGLPPPTRILGAKSLFSLVYGYGIAAKSSKQRSYPQNPPSKEVMRSFGPIRQISAGRRRKDSWDHCATNYGNHLQALAATCGGAVARFSLAWTFVVPPFAKYAKDGALSSSRMGFVVFHICHTERGRYGHPAEKRGPGGRRYIPIFMLSETWQTWPRYTGPAGILEDCLR